MAHRSETNFNNRAEEAVGTANDALVAYRERAFGDQAPKPWLGWLMLLEDCADSQQAVGVAEPHFPVFPEFKDSSYAKRYEILLRKLRLENLFNETALILTKESQAKTGAYSEPATDLSMQRFLASFAGHIAGIIAS
ncbi:MAG: PaeR7I family type II restriction endonuclease [Acidobacteriota bacterium]